MLSIDGRLAPPSGGKTQLGSKADRRVLEQALAWADGVLIGGETLRIHKNTCLIHNQELISQRILEGKSQQPIAIVISKKNNHSRTLDFFSQPIQRWLLNPNQVSHDSTIPIGFEKQICLQSNWGNTIAE